MNQTPNLTGRAGPKAPSGRVLMIAAGGLVAAGGWALAGWIALALAVVGTAGLLLLLATSHAQALGARWRRRPIPIPAPWRFANRQVQRTRTRLRIAQRERLALRRRLAGRCPASLLAQVDGARDLERQAVALLRKVDDLTQYLLEKDRDLAWVDLEGLADGVAGERADDRIFYEVALAARGSRLAALGEIAAMRRACAARLEALTASLEAVPVLLARIEIGEDVERLDDAPLREGAWIVEGLRTTAAELAASGRAD